MSAIETRLSATSSTASPAGALLWLPLIAVFVLGVALRHVVVANTDVSWLITLCERVLSGEVPYRDFIEVNPPASILLYLLPVAIARTVGIAPEIVVDLFVFLSVAVSLWLSTAIVRFAALFDRRTTFHLAALFSAALLLLQAQNLGEREHIALIAFLPFLAVMALRALLKPVRLWCIIAAGIGAGIVVVIKPHFVFALIFTAAVAAWHARSWRVFFFAAENWIAAALLAGYAAIVIVAFPYFISETLPLVAEIYVPVRAPLIMFLIHFATPILFLALAAIYFLDRKLILTAPFSLLIAASLGFAVSYYLQQKGWSYHSYPMLALAVVAATIAFAARWPLQMPDMDNAARVKRITASFAIMLLAGATFLWMNFAVDMRALAEPIARVAPRPSVLAITSDIAIGHPLTRQLRGRWVGRVCSQWIAVGARLLRNETQDQEVRARYDALEVQDRGILVEDIRKAKPDIILVDRIRFDWLAWAKADPVLAGELAKYRAVATINDVMILRRN